MQDTHDLISILSNAQAVADVDFHSAAPLSMPPPNKRRKSDDGMERMSRLAELDRPPMVQKQSSVPELPASRYSSNLDNMARDLFARHQQRRKTIGDVLGFSFPAPGYKDELKPQNDSFGKHFTLGGSSQFSPETTSSMTSVQANKSLDGPMQVPLECKSMSNSLINGLTVQTETALTKNDQDLSESAPAKKRRSWKKPKDKPKRPLSAYNLFFQQEREGIVGSQKCKQEGKRRHRKAHGKIGFADLAKTIAEKWKNLDEPSKAVFDEKAGAEKARYKKELELWVKKRELKKQEEKEKQNFVFASPGDGLSRDGDQHSGTKRESSSTNLDTMWFDLHTDTVSELVDLVHSLPGDSSRAPSAPQTTKSAPVMLDADNLYTSEMPSIVPPKNSYTNKTVEAQLMQALGGDGAQDDDFADLMSMPLPLD